MVEATLLRAPASALAGHFHDTANRAIANVEVSWNLGLRVEKASSNEFWDRLLAEIHAQMGKLEAAGHSGGGFMPRDLMEAIPQSLRSEAVRRGENLKPSKLESRMSMRAKYGKLFVEEAKCGPYRRLVGDVAATG